MHSVTAIHANQVATRGMCMLGDMDVCALLFGCLAWIVMGITTEGAGAGAGMGRGWAARGARSGCSTSKSSPWAPSWMSNTIRPGALRLPCMYDSAMTLSLLPQAACGQSRLKCWLRLRARRIMSKSRSIECHCIETFMSNFRTTTVTVHALKLRQVSSGRHQVAADSRANRMPPIGAMNAAATPGQESHQQGTAMVGCHIYRLYLCC